MLLYKKGQDLEHGNQNNSLSNFENNSSGNVYMTSINCKIYTSSVLLYAHELKKKHILIKLHANLR